MKKNEAEIALRRLCHAWREQTGRGAIDEQQLHFSDYISWVREGYGQYLKFKSVMPVIDVVEMWFDQEFHQTWCN